jgi:glycosyltransferase involved in cell wall biosynthesis
MRIGERHHRGGRLQPAWFSKSAAKVLPVKLLFYAGGFPPIGGIETFIRDLSKALTLHGHRVELLCWGPKSDLLEEIGRHSAVRRLSFRWGCRLLVPDLMLATQTALRGLPGQDIVVLTKLPPWPVLYFLRQVCRGHHYRPLVYVTPYRPRELWGGGKPAEAMINLFDAIIIQAKDFAEDLRAYGYRGAIETIPYIPPPLDPPSDLPDCGNIVRIGFIGRLVPQKNLQYLLKAFALLRADSAPGPASRSWELHLYGDGDQRRALENAASAYGLQKQICFHGAIPHQAVKAAIDQCHLFAFSSIAEGQCLAALEILARGRPVVATPVGAFPEILTSPDLGAIAPLDDAAQFARILAEVGSSLIEGRTAPEAIQRRFDSQLCHEKIVQKYCSFFSGLTSTVPLRRRA